MGFRDRLFPLIELGKHAAKRLARLPRPAPAAYKWHGKRGDGAAAAVAAAAAEREHRRELEGGWPGVGAPELVVGSCLVCRI